MWPTRSAPFRPCGPQACFWCPAPVAGSVEAPPGAWVISFSQVTTPDGRAPASEPAGPCADPAAQPGAGPTPPSPAEASACNEYIAGLHLRQTVTYQPASRYWAFQWAETAICLALALALAGFSFWWVNRGRSTELSVHRPPHQPARPRAPKVRVTFGDANDAGYFGPLQGPKVSRLTVERGAG